MVALFLQLHIRCALAASDGSCKYMSESELQQGNFLPNVGTANHSHSKKC